MFKSPTPNHDQYKKKSPLDDTTQSVALLPGLSVDLPPKIERA